MRTAYRFLAIVPNVPKRYGKGTTDAKVSIAEPQKDVCCALNRGELTTCGKRGRYERIVTVERQDRWTGQVWTGIQKVYFCGVHDPIRTRQKQQDRWIADQDAETERGKKLAARKAELFRWADLINQRVGTTVAEVADYRLAITDAPSLVDALPEMPTAEQRKDAARRT